MKLTNSIRDKFIKSAMSDVPKTDYETQAQTMAKDWIEKHMRSIFPGVDMAKAQEWIKQRTIYLPGNLQCFYWFSHDCYILQHDTKLWSKLEAISKENDAQCKRLEELSEQLRGCAYSVTTVKALGELLPEFAHYLPSESTPVKMLPATTGVVKAFHAAGWPKTKTA